MNDFLNKIKHRATDIERLTVQLSAFMCVTNAEARSYIRLALHAQAVEQGETHREAIAEMLRRNEVLLDAVKSTVNDLRGPGVPLMDVIENLELALAIADPK